MRALDIKLFRDLAHLWAQSLAIAMVMACGVATLILWTAFPLLLSGIIALTFGSQASGTPKVRLLVEDRDGGLLSGVVVSALESEQSAEFLDVSAVPEGEGAALMEKVASLVPGLEQVFFCNSGTEAVEAALKFARISTGRTPTPRGWAAGRSPATAPTSPRSSGWRG